MKIVNTFRQGLDRDSSKNKYDNVHYYDALNMRIITQDGLSSGALENVKGNYARLNLTALGWIVGHVVLGDYLVLWSTTNNSDTPSILTTDRISIIPVADIEALSGASVYTATTGYYHAGGNVVYSGNLELCTGNPVKAIPRYESAYIQKVYWIDGYNRLRHLNIIYDADTNDLDNLPEDKLEVVGNIVLTQPELDAIVTGNLQVGKIQYTYQLYNVGGSETIFSPVSKLINITDKSESLTTTESYKGGDVGTNSGKGVKVSIFVNTEGYYRLRLVAINYTTLNGDPEIRVVEEVTLTGVAGETIYITDTGGLIDTLLLEDIRTLGTFLFVPKEIETKDNILFPANITEESFDVDYDARAYRFAGLSSTPGDPNYNASYGDDTAAIARVYQEDDTYYEILGTTKALSGTAPGASGTWSSIPLIADCINKFNNLDNDGDHDYRFMYQSDGETIGGEGPNISYEFDVNRQIIDQELTDARRLYTNIEGSASNPSYYGYASPYFSNLYVGYNRDEIYRFGIVFFDAKGRSSFVKWIGDIRMPSNSTEITSGTLASGGTVFNIITVGTAVNANILYLKFTVNNIPSEADSYQIVRVKRSSLDRTVVAQGMVGDFNESGGDLTHTSWNTAAGAGNGIPFHSFHSPEVSFNKNLVTQSNDFFQVISGAGADLDTYTTGNVFDVYKYRLNSALANPDTPASTAGSGDEFYSNNFTDIDEGFIVTQDGGDKDIDSYTYLVNNATRHTDKGLNFLFKASNASWVAHQDGGTAKKYVNYRRNLYAAQYGGITYSARTRNVYIPASDIVNVALSSVSCYGGDTYVGMFDCLISSWEDQYAHDGTYPIPEIVHMPVETSINLPLRLDDCYHREYLASNVQFMHDTAGVWGDGSSEYTQERDLYVYNTVYSKEDDTNLFLPKPLDWRENTDYITRILASEVKINNEYIDSWLKYPTNQYLDVDPQYGEITGLVNVNDQMLFFQPKAFGILTINERALVQTERAEQLSLGKSGVLEDYRYAKTNMGLSNRFHYVLTNNALYWTDLINKSIYKFTGGPEDVTGMKGMDSWARSAIVNLDMRMYYDPEFKEVYLTDNTDSWTLMYNEWTDSFISFMSFKPTYTLRLNNKLYTSINEKNFFRHNDASGSRGVFYDFEYDSRLTLLINPDNTGVATFNNMEWLTEVFNTSTGADLRYTFDSVWIWNDHQSTGSDIPLTEFGNMRRRARHWRFTIPRATKMGDHVTDLDRFDSRFRDSHLFARFTFDNGMVGVPRKLVVHDIITSYNPSNM